MTALERTGLLKWLLARVRRRGSDGNRLYASELLAILMQARAAAARRRVFGRVRGAVPFSTACGAPSQPAPARARVTVPSPPPFPPPQGHEANQRALGKADGIDALLLAISPYKGRDPQARLCVCVGAASVWGGETVQPNLACVQNICHVSKLPS